MKKLILVMLLTISGATLAQENAELLKNPLTRKSYNLKVMEDLNLIITGDKNLKQGLSYAYNKANEQITLSGSLWSFKNCGLLTLDGKFESNEGSVLFNNNEKGTKRFGVTLNYFFSIGVGNNSKFGFINNSTSESNRSLLALDYNWKYTNNKEKLTDSLAAYLTFAKIFNISTSKNEEIQYVRKGTVSKEMIGSLFKKYYSVKTELQEKTVSKLLEMGKCRPEKLGKYEKNYFEKNDGTTILIGYTYEGFKMQVFLKDLQKLVDRYKNYDQIVYQSERKLAENLWTGHSLWFFGIHGVYNRESIDIFKYEENFSSFNEELFKTKRGDIFELGASFNYFHTFKKKNYFFFGKGFLTLSNNSNISNFSKYTYEYLEGISDTLFNDNTVSRKFSKTGYINKNGRAYSDKGIGFGSGAELYGGHKKIGVFTRIEFEESKSDKKLYTKKIPWRAGIYINFTSKEKELLSILLFTERTNMILHPREDFNIGFKIGLPLNLNKAI